VNKHSLSGRPGNHIKIKLRLLTVQAISMTGQKQDHLFPAAGLFNRRDHANFTPDNRERNHGYKKNGGI
jgi:hypothetical protein